MALPTAIIFDGDDTLWHNQIYYTRAIIAFLDRMEREGFDPQTARSLFDEYERRNVREMGLSRQRFATSMVNTYHALCRRTRHLISPELETHVFQIGQSVFDQRPTLLEGAREVLTHLAHQSHYRLFLCTAGDLTVQQSKVTMLNVASYFEGISFPALKNRDSLLRLLHEYQLDPTQTWMIGNSWHSDIAPSLELGLRCIWFQGESWAYDVSTLEAGSYPILLAESLREVPALLQEYDQTTIPSWQISL